ncbi:MAG TPA: NAD-dependent epimerase/dehydratase family protein [Sedimentisphaerales bacterium]|nr:NAD-dependent epimerase/dehydratase family protein [Sedimentisphaerales bacterium]
MTQILVTGATGLLGRQLIQSLQERGDALRALVLAGEDAAWLEERGIAVYRGDVREPDTLVEPMRGVDKIFHLAGMMGIWCPMRDYYAVNVTGTENVCVAALTAGVRRLIHVSSWTVYGMGLGRVVHEDSPLMPMSEPYAVTKTEGDKVVQCFIASHDLPAVIIRPDTFFGPGDRVHFERMADRLRAGKGIIIGSGRNLLPFAYVSDIVQGLLLAGDNDRAVGQAYNIANDQLFTQEQLWRAIAEAVGAKPPRIHVPYAALYPVSAIIERAAILARYPRQPLITRVGVNVFGTENRHAIDKARAELGYAPRVSLSEGVRLTANWYLQQHTPGAISVSEVARLEHA